MKAHTLHGTPAQPPDGIYPFAELPVRLGFPSRDDFEIIYNAKGKAAAVAALRDFPGSAESAGLRGNYCLIAASIPGNWRLASMSTTRASAGCCITPATQTSFST